LASLHLGIGRQLLSVQRQMRKRVWQAAYVGLTAVTLDTDTTVHTLFGKQMGGRKGYNPKNKGKKSYQHMSSEGWCIQWEPTPPEQKARKQEAAFHGEGEQVLQALQAMARCCRVFMGFSIALTAMF
jgi:hypothetical protein